LFVVVRDIAGDVTVERQIGYCAKDYGQPHFAVDYIKGITHDVLRASGAEYEQVAGGNVFHSRTELKPYTMWSLVAKFEHSNLYPLCMKMIVFQVVRFMLLTKKYMLGPTWCAPYGGRLAVRATHAWQNIPRMLRLFGTVDLYDVVAVLTRGDYGSPSEAYQYMSGRDERFDDMSFEEANRLFRQALNVLQPNMQHGVVVGDVDLDALCANLDAGMNDAVAEEDGGEVQANEDLAEHHDLLGQAIVDGAQHANSVNEQQNDAEHQGDLDAQGWLSGELHD
jgi:hypothetical protein